MTTERKLEELEILLCEVYDMMVREGEISRAREIGFFLRMISEWRNEEIDQQKGLLGYLAEDG